MIGLGGRAPSTLGFISGDAIIPGVVGFVYLQIGSLRLFWPIELPQSLLQSAQDTRTAGSVHFAAETGKPIARRTHGNVSRHLKAPLTLDTGQRIVFEEFFNVSLRGGTLEFEWLDPLTDTKAKFRFRTPPEWTLSAEDFWNAEISVELLP